MPNNNMNFKFVHHVHKNRSHLFFCYNFRSCSQILIKFDKYSFSNEYVTIWRKKHVYVHYLVMLRETQLLQNSVISGNCQQNLKLKTKKQLIVSMPTIMSLVYTATVNVQRVHS